MMNLPDKYLNEMKELLKDDFDNYLDSFNSPSISSIRINNHKISNEDFISLSPFNLEKIDWIHNGYYVDEKDKPGKHPYYDAGLYYVQEASAMTPAECLEINKGDFVLDCCAAPGGKTTELLSKLNNTGLLVANDISISRAYSLAKNIQRLGFTNAIVTAEDTKNLVNYFNNYFDKILVDAPCSGEGMFRKDDSLIKSWMEKDSDFYPSIQKDILDKACNMLKPGGKILYSTCTFAIKEDEDVIEEILNKHRDIKVIDLPIKYDKFEQGKTENTKKAIRLYPHKLKGEGHFVCLLQKDGNLATNNIKEIKSVKLNDDVKSFLNECHLNEDNKHYELINSELYLVPNMNINTKGLRIILSGLHLGTIKKERFSPSSPLALSLKDYPRIINLKSDDINVVKYLKGETINVASELNGNVLIAVDNFPLGFGKITNGIIKNKIEKGWIKQ